MMTSHQGKHCHSGNEVHLVIIEPDYLGDSLSLKINSFVSALCIPLASVLGRGGGERGRSKPLEMKDGNALEHEHLHCTWCSLSCRLRHHHK